MQQFPTFPKAAIFAFAKTKMSSLLGPGTHPDT